MDPVSARHVVEGARRSPGHASRRQTATERVVVLVATRDDPAFALERVRNLRAAEYPASLLRVVVAVDVDDPASARCLSSGTWRVLPM